MTLHFCRITNMGPLREWAKQLKRHALTLYYAVCDPRTPWLDEIGLLPAAIWPALKLVPAAVLETARRKAEQTSERPTSTAAAIVIVVIWVLLATLFGWWVYQLAT